MATKTKKAAQPAANKPKTTRAKSKSTREPMPQATTSPTRCRKCGSTRRTAYHGTTTRAITGIDPTTGQPYTHVIWSRTACLDCGQHRMDKRSENRPDGDL